MKIDITGRNVEMDDAVRAFAERKIRFSMGRLSNRIAGVRVLVSDVNGPKGGRDTECLVEVRFRSAGRLTAKVTADDVYAAVGRAAERAGYAVSEWAKRSRAFDRTPIRAFVNAAGPSVRFGESLHSA